MPTVVENIELFKNELSIHSPEEIAKEWILSGEAVHVPSESIQFIKNRICRSFRVEEEDIDVLIVGSAKLGFSISEKRKNGRLEKRRYRLFSLESDIDVAVISKKLFENMWNSLSSYSITKNPFPWDSGPLGDYLICGWIRPDHLPEIIHSKFWWDCFNDLSRNSKLGRRKIRGCLYYSNEYLLRYQTRSVKECLIAKEIST